jgi:hypothetical protein
MFDSMEDPLNVPTTIGMHIDAAINRMTSLSSTELYGVIVAATIGLCFLLLGNGTKLEDNICLPPAQNVSRERKQRSGPRPRWHIFRWVNYAFVIGFGASVVTFITNSSYYLQQDQGTLIQFLVGWSVFLCYFFGFFGVSLVHELTEDEQHAEEAAQAMPKKHSEVKSVGYV